MSVMDLLNEVSELVYVADANNYDLLYVNEPGKKIFRIDGVKGLKCYEAFHHQTSPCEFCNTRLLKNDATYTWEHYNQVSGCTYLLKDRLMMWGEREARVEFAFDISPQTKERQKLKNALDAEKMVLNCVDKLYRDGNLVHGVQNMLAQLGQELQADRTYIFEIRDGMMFNTYEWCAGGVKPQIELLQNMDMRQLLKRWLPYFNEGECVIIKDLSAIREVSGMEYDWLTAHNVTSLAAAPLEQDGRLSGFMGVDNPSLGKARSIGTSLNTLAYFLMTTICRVRDQEKLVTLGYRDSLTGLYNRNRYIKDMEGLRGGQESLGVVYMDLNGLKEINDHQGHTMGDAALIKCGENLQSAFADAKVYRIGGDEFVALLSPVKEDEFYRQVREFKTLFSEDSRYKVAVGTGWSDGPADISRMIQDAEVQMYEDKRRFYRSHVQSSRYRGFEDERFSRENPLLRDYNLLMSSMKVSVSKHLFRQDFKVVWANDYFYLMTGYTKEEYEEKFGGNCEAYFQAERGEYNRLFSVVSTAFKEGKTQFESLLHMPVKDGSRLWIKVVGSFTGEKIDGVPVIYAVFTNVSDLVRMQKEQVITYEGLPGFMAKMQLKEERPYLLYGNKKFSEFFGNLDRARELLEINLEINKEVINQHYADMRKGNAASFEVSAKNMVGDLAQFQIWADCIDWITEDPVFLILFIDITQSNRQKEELKRLAYVDPVTGGLNRNRFEREAGKAVAESPADTYALVSLDIQKFKVINDLFGIENGDRTLDYVYRKMVSHLQEGEFAARLSSDVFNMLLKTDIPEKLEKRIADLAEDINEFNQYLEHKYLLTLTAGIYPIDDPLMPMTRLQDQANVARKKAKNASGTQLYVCQFYSNGDRLWLAREKEIENQMQDALKEQQFVVYLQPKQDLNTGEVAGAEALVRWLDPVKGMIPPAEFISLFERNGFVVELDLYVFDCVCRLLRDWLDRGIRPVPISVNMSQVHLNNLDFMDWYEAIRERYKVPANLLEIELTETLVFDNPDLLAGVIDSIKSLGYSCSMDDFGSGYSSLNVLKSIRVDTLKLDKAFFSEEQTDSIREEAIISVVVELARKLNMRTVAEGVETEAQAEFLKRSGCDMIQGYLFSKPLGIEEFEKRFIG